MLRSFDPPPPHPKKQNIKFEPYVTSEKNLKMSGGTVAFDDTFVFLYNNRMHHVNAAWWSVKNTVRSFNFLPNEAQKTQNVFGSLWLFSVSFRNGFTDSPKTSTFTQYCQQYPRGSPNILLPAFLRSAADSRGVGGDFNGWGSKVTSCELINYEWPCIIWSTEFARKSDRFKIHGRCVFVEYEWAKGEDPDLMRIKIWEPSKIQEVFLIQMLIWISGFLGKKKIFTWNTQIKKEPGAAVSN